MNHTLRAFLALTIGIFSVPSLAEDNFSGFLGDYEELQPAEDVSPYSDAYTYMLKSNI